MIEDEDVCVSVFSAASGGTARASALLDVPIAMIAIAMQPDIAIRALNQVRYGAGHVPSGGTDAAGAGWDDWHLLILAPPTWIMSREAPVPIDGTIRVPLDEDVEIDVFAKRLKHRLRTLLLPLPTRSLRILHRRADFGASTVARPSRRPKPLPPAPVDDLYVFEPKTQSEWLYDMTAAALEDARRIAWRTARRDGRKEEGP